MGGKAGGEIVGYASPPEISTINTQGQLRQASWMPINHQANPEIT